MAMVEMFIDLTPIEDLLKEVDDSMGKFKISDAVYVTLLDDVSKEELAFRALTIMRDIVGAKQ